MVKDKLIRNHKKVTWKNGLNGFNGNIKFNCSRSWTYMCAKGIPIIGFLLITMYLMILSSMIIIFCVFYAYMQGHLTIFIQWGSELIEKNFQIFFTIFFKINCKIILKFCIFLVLEIPVLIIVIFLPKRKFGWANFSYKYM